MSLINTTGNTDLFQAYFTHTVHPIDTCGSPNKELEDLKKLFAHYSTEAQQQSICFWDIQHLIDTVDVEGWAEHQYIVDGDTFTIRDLSSWEPPQGTDHIPGSVPSSITSVSITLVNSWLLFLMMISCTLYVMS